MTRHSEQRHLPYAPEQLFDLVADVERYPDFVPGLLAAHIHRRDGHRVWVDMTVGAGPLRRRFSSQADLHRPSRIEIASHDPLFEIFRQVWTFALADGGGTTVTYAVDVRFRSSLLQAAIGSRFAPMGPTVVSAFQHRARAIYGPAAAPVRNQDSH